MTFRIKVRGAGGQILHEYLCPIHGRFEQLVDRETSPDVVSCPIEDDCYGCGGQPSAPGAPHCDVCDGRAVATCGEPSPWSPSSAPAVHTQFVVSATQGKNAAKPHRDAMDTRMLAEGRRNDYRAQRKKVREGLRHQRVKALLS